MGYLPIEPNWWFSSEGVTIVYGEEYIDTPQHDLNSTR